MQTGTKGQRFKSAKGRLCRRAQARKGKKTVGVQRGKSARMQKGRRGKCAQRAEVQKSKHAQVQEGRMYGAMNDTITHYKSSNVIIGFDNPYKGQWNLL